MKKLQKLCLAALGFLMAACSADDPGTPGGGDYGQPVTVSVSISARQGAVTRAWDGTVHDNESGLNELMNSWFVAVVDNGGTIVKLLRSGSISDLEEDNVAGVTLAAGTYRFYSFANIAQKDVLGTETVTEGTTKMPDLTEKTYTVSASDLNSGTATAGIPMSNMQEITVSAGTDEVDLWVVRMVAKIELRLKNSTSHDITVNSVTLSDVTADGTENVFLLPEPTGKTDAAACTPHLKSGAATADMTLTLPEAVTLTAGAEDYTAVTFYVNESATPTNNHGLFILTLGTQSGSSAEPQRYALISNDDDNWNYIARNDYRIIPVTLDDYRLDLKALTFEAIGVLPDVQKAGKTFTCTFHSPVHFHLLPVVTQLSTGVELSYGTAPGTWTADASTCWEQTVSGYTNSDIYMASTDTEHGSDNGGVPLWWSDDAKGEHFVFGKFNNTEGRAWHRLTVTVNRSDATPATRTLTYQICVVRTNL